MQTPDALVLGGGGILGEAWMSALLAGLDEGEEFDSRSCPQFVGTSAGSIVAASLAAGIGPGSRLGDLPSTPPLVPEDQADAGASSVLSSAALLGSAAAAPLASLALSSTAAGGALLRRAALRRAPVGRRSLAALTEAVERSGASWDGRLRIVAVEIESGARVVFGSSSAPAISVARAVEASCSIPGVFRPVRSGEHTYVDGGVWSPTNIDAAEVHSGQQVLCLNPTGSLRPTLGGLTGTLGPISRGVARTEALALQHRGIRVETINPDRRSAAVLGANLMDAQRRDEVIAAGVAQGRRLALARDQAA
ncbi:MAG TPA: patatin-like phospholipase family protein [Solirubrobacteraceae bacterium]|jgi:NTE family protein|nr:patatin-like phospholipase family protein [Solirubrobacteraceae bacterium]